MPKRKGKWPLAIAVAVVIAALAIPLIIRHLRKTGGSACIAMVLAQDDAWINFLHTSLRGHKARTDDDFDRIVEDFKGFVQEEQGIGTDRCPREFADAFSSYVAALADEKEVLRARPLVPSGEEAFVADFAGGLLGDTAAPPRATDAQLKEWLGRWREKSDRARQAEREMKAIATRYGAL